jgi:hypothetical protein
MRVILLLISALSSFCFGLRADINHDGIVDLQDLSILSEEWLMSEYGDNLVTNGTFDTDSGWTKGSGWSINTTTKKAVFLAPAVPGTLSQSVSVVTGKTYQVVYTLSSQTFSTGGGCLVSVGGTSGTKRTTANTYTENIVATSTAGLFFLLSDGALNDTFTIDAVTVKEVSNVGTLWEQALIQTLLANVAVSAYLGDNIFLGYAPPTVTRPYVIFEQLSGPRDYTFDGPNGLATISIQMSIFDSTYLGTRTIADVIRRCLDGFEGTVSLTGGGSVKILETKLRDEGDIPSERPDNTVIYGKRQDYEMIIDERP